MGQCEDNIKNSISCGPLILIRRECINCVYSDWLIGKSEPKTCSWSVKTTSGITPYNLYSRVVLGACIDIQRTNTGCALCSLDVWLMWEKQNISCQPSPSSRNQPAFIILITKQNIFELTISPTQQAAAMQWRWAHSDNWGVCTATTEYIWRNNIWYWLWHSVLQCWHQYTTYHLLALVNI